MHRKDVIYLTVVFLMYLLLLYFIKPVVFKYRFNEKLIDRYYLSQDIPHEVNGVRQFLSDSEIHTAAGYLYATGDDPTAYNFQHAPFIKYLYGFSIRFFNTPYPAQLLLGMCLLLTTYFVGKKLFKKPEVSLLACLFLVIDPLFLDLSSQLLLDLGQSFFLLLYFFLLIYHRKKVLVQGVVLGLLLASKFWGGTLFFIAAFHSFLYYKKELKIKPLMVHMIVAAFVFCGVYSGAFIAKKGLFNIIFFELKTLKYWLNHSVSSFFGSSLILFLSGYITSWWGKKEIISSGIWTLFWPVALVINTIAAVRLFISKKLNEQFVLLIVPLLYLVYLGVQAPFARYFILILPFLYLGFSHFLVEQ